MGSTFRRWLLGIAGVLLLITSGLYVLAFVLVPADESPPPTAPIGGEKKSGADTPSVVGGQAPDEVPIPTKPPSDPRWAFLLLGYGGGGHDGAYLTDSIMVAIADPPKKTLTLLSIPRDSWVPMLFDGKTAVYNKINTAYAFATDRTLHPNRLPRYSGSQGAGTFVKDTVARLLDIPISNYVALDFVGFRQMIDTLGGIDVSVPASFDALYPANDDPSVDPSWTVIRFNKGLEHMNGERAIRFARARETINNVSEGSDFARSRRQRVIIESFKTALFQPGGLLRMPQILGIASRHVDTDYAIPDVGQLGSFLADWKEVRIHQTALTFDNYLREGTGHSGTYVLVPSFSDGTWTQIRAFARRLWRDPDLGMAMAGTTITVVNRTGRSGAAGQLSETLARLGYRVAAPVSGDPHPSSRLVGSGDAARLLAAQLAKDLGVSIPLASDGSASNAAALILDLGADDLALVELSVPNDPMAPSSLVGILRGPPLYSAPQPSEEDPEGGVPSAETPTPARASTIAAPRPATSPPGQTRSATTGTPGTTPTPVRRAPTPTLNSVAGTWAPAATSTPSLASRTATAIPPTATRDAPPPTSTVTALATFEPTTPTAALSPTSTTTKSVVATPTATSAVPSPTSIAAPFATFTRTATPRSTPPSPTRTPTAALSTATP